MLQTWNSIFLINFAYSVWHWGQLNCCFVYNVTIKDWIKWIVSVEYWSVHWASIFKVVLNIEQIKIWFRNGKYVLQQEVIIWFCFSSVTEKCKMNITLKLHASEILLPQKPGTFCIFTVNVFSAIFQYCQGKNRLTCVTTLVFITVR